MKQQKDMQKNLQRGRNSVLSLLDLQIIRLKKLRLSR
uniref:Uncharacterized protein n=1 Tax=Siphoviridae sp. ctqzz19 TaxID=2825682 RepID=A0A8S5U2A8_9CAUD|nr:MAG TPA: hypothetical protein [Siphoviridae sp. ctqzz19]